MTEKLTSPIDKPKIAAQEILALLVESGAFKPSTVLNAPSIGKQLITLHQELTAYYETLSK